MDTPESPNASVVVSYMALSGVLGPAARADGVLFQRSGFRIRRTWRRAGSGFSAPDMDRVCEITVIPNVVANVDALATAQTNAAECSVHSLNKSLSSKTRSSIGRVIFTSSPVTSTTASSPVVECPVDRMKNLSAA